MSILENSVRQKHCQELSKHELMELMEDLDVIAEIKVPTQIFVRFLTLNICSLVDIVLNDPEATQKVASKIMYIITSNLSDIRYVMTRSDCLLVLMLNFLKQTLDKLNSKRVTRFAKILSQLILKSEYDFLGKIPNPYQFMSSLFTMSKYFAIEEFLSEFLCSDNLIFLRFFEHARVGSILTHQIQMNPNNCEVYLNLLYKLADNPHVSSRFFIPLYSRQFAMTLISIGRTSKSANVSALAFEFVAMKLIENKYPKEARDSVKGQLVAICRFITSKSTQKFDCSLRCAIDLLISIIHTKNNAEQEIFFEEEEDIYEEDEEFIIEPSPVSRPRPNIPPLPRKSVQIMQNCPLSPDRKGTHSGPLNPNISQTNSSFYASKTKTAKSSKINFNTLPREEANPDFNSVLFSKSCPVFSGLYTIEEDQEIIGSPLESNLLPSVTSSEKFRRLSDTDPTVEAARALLRAFFNNPNCTFLHSAVFDLLSEIAASTDLFAVIIVSFDFKKYAIDALLKNPMAPYIGYIHEIIRLIQGDGELVDIAFVIDEDWEDKEEFYLIQEELPEVHEFTGILQIESPRIW